MSNTISEQALISRLRRRMRRDGETFRITREPYHRDNGRWHSTDQTNYMSGRWDSLDELIEYARRAGVLGAHEAVSS